MEEVGATLASECFPVILFISIHTQPKHEPLFCKIIKVVFSLRASSPIWASLARMREREAEAACSRILTRLALVTQIGELARRLSGIS